MLAQQLLSFSYSKTKKTIILVLLSFIFAFAYAILRYVVFGPYEINAIPLYILNKAFAFSFMIMSFFLSSPGMKFLDRKFLGIMTYLSGLFHGILSVILLPTGFFSKFYNENGQLSLCAASMIFFGVTAIILSVIIAKSFIHGGSASRFWKSFEFEKMYIFFLLFLGLHIFIYYFPNWYHVSGWYGYMPPISLLSFLILIAITINFLTRVFSKE